MEPSDEINVPTHRLHFSLKTLLLIIAGVAIVLAPFRWFGLAYLISVSLSTLLSVGCVLAYRSRQPAWSIGVAAAGAVAFFPFIIVLAVAFFHAVLNAVLCVPLVFLRVRTRTFAIAVTGLAFAVYGDVLWFGAIRVRELIALKLAYPFESLDARLEFERSRKFDSSISPATSQLTPTIVENLDEQENALKRSPYSSRTWGLEELHEHSYRQFARAAGFGVMRMPSVDPGFIKLEPRAPLALPVPLAIQSPNPTANVLYPVHRSAIADFLDPNRMGYVRSRGEASGFESHVLSTIGEDSTGGSEAENRWQVVRLELVSLLRNEEPRVYLAVGLPPMDKLAGVPHRALNQFEAGALPQLETAKDLVIEQQPKRIEMLGAVRAATNCLACHEGQRGELLGAFSYEITPLVSTDRAAN